MEDHNLTYNLTYPDPFGAYESQNEDSSLVLSMDDDKKPVVLLLGWAGAQDKYLQVYSRIYEAKGLITLRCIVPLTTMFLKKSQMPLIGEKVVKLLNDLNLELRPIFVHLFSNGGSFMYQHFAKAVGSSPKPLQIKGVLFDSAPCTRRLSSYAGGLRPIVGGNKLFNNTVVLFAMFFVLITWMWEYIMMNVFKIDLIQFHPFKNLINERNNWPQHFMYSKTDSIVPYQDVEFFASHRKSLGIDVSMKQFDGTSHVKHYPGHKFTYTQSVFSFMSKCLDLSMV